MEKIITRKVKESLKNTLEQAALRAREEGKLTFEELPAVILEVPKDKSHGNFASNMALILAKTVKKAPRDTAQIILQSMQPNPYIDKSEVAGPGFINFYLNDSWLTEVLETIIAEKVQYGDNSDLTGVNVQLEFVSANPVGPMVVGNARAAALGDTLGNLMSACGAKVWREYYVNDYGVQVETLGRSIDARYRELLGQKVEFPEDGYRGEYIYDIAREFIAEKGDDYLEFSEPERVKIFKDLGYTRILASQKEDLGNYGVHYDCWFSERSLHEQGAVTQIMKDLEEKGLTFKQDGALWLKTTDYGDDKDRVLTTADGRTTYFTSDIAYHVNKFNRGFNLLIYIWGPDNHGYIP